MVLQFIGCGACGEGGGGCGGAGGKTCFIAISILYGEAQI
jgi:hypothetical protein